MIGNGPNIQIGNAGATRAARIIGTAYCEGIGRVNIEAPDYPNWVECREDGPWVRVMLDDITPGWVRFDDWARITFGAR